MFRGATRSDLPEILKIYARAREAMAAAGNPAQWGASFPPEELLKEDIDSTACLSTSSMASWKRCLHSSSARTPRMP